MSPIIFDGQKIGDSNIEPNFLTVENYRGGLRSGFFNLNPTLMAVNTGKCVDGLFIRPPRSACMMSSYLHLRAIGP